LVRRWAEKSFSTLRLTACFQFQLCGRDGTAQIFSDDPRVFTLSVHCKSNFPLRKQHSRIDVELDAGVGDHEYLQVLEAVLPRVWEFKPQAVLYQSGVDGLASDELGHLELTHAGLLARDPLVMRQVREQGVPFIVTLGGYSLPLELTVEAHANTLCTAREIFSKDGR